MYLYTKTGTHLHTCFLSTYNMYTDMHVPVFPHHIYSFTNTPRSNVIFSETGEEAFLEVSACNTAIQHGAEAVSAALPG